MKAIIVVSLIFYFGAASAEDDYGKSQAINEVCILETYLDVENCAKNRFKNGLDEKKCMSDFVLKYITCMASEDKEISLPRLGESPMDENSSLGRADKKCISDTVMDMVKCAVGSQVEAGFSKVNWKEIAKCAGKSLPSSIMCFKGK